ncbi:MAG: cobalamin B12-binding domain-containing protein [Peptostreptococcaceae bacterium]
MSMYEKISKAVEEGNVNDTMMLVKKAIGLRYSVENVLNKGLIEGINNVADKFKDDKVLIPEVFMSTRAINAGISVLRPYYETNVKRPKVKVVIGTVAGDIHDIGKNIVTTFLKSLNLEVIDLGTDVPKEVFVNTIEKERPDILMMSSLLSTTIWSMRDVIKELEKRDLRDDLTIFIGGAPVDQSFCEKIGADYYTESASELKSFIEEKLQKINVKIF